MNDYNQWPVTVDQSVGVLLGMLPKGEAGTKWADLFIPSTVNSGRVGLRSQFIDFIDKHTT